MKSKRTKLDRLCEAAQAARHSYYTSRSDAARKRLKTALKNVLLAGGRLHSNRSVSDWQNDIAEAGE